LSEIMAAHGVPYVATASIGHLADLKRKVEKAKALRGLRLITLLIPCLDGWGLADDGALAAARCAVECGAFPLYEIEDGQRYTLNNSRRSRPVADYLALQRRYRGLPAAQVQALQAEVDEAWARLQQRAAASAPAPGAPSA
jgi:pyruvate/2-oxoacid:ferredoxin oxidoreductase beta subunit